MRSPNHGVTTKPLMEAVVQFEAHPDPIEALGLLMGHGHDVTRNGWRPFHSTQTNNCSLRLQV